MQSAEVILVNRARLVNLLERNCVSKEYLLAAAADLRRKGGTRMDIPYPGVRLVRSVHLREEPINLLVTRKVLRSIGQILLS